MRALTASQKRLLVRVISEQNYRDRLGELHFTIRGVEDLPNGVFEELEKINDTEVLYQNTNQFIDDFNSRLN